MPDAEQISEYRYCGVPLSPAIASELLTTALSQTHLPASRKSLVDFVRDSHTRGGGHLNADITATVKKALRTLKFSGRITSPRQGYYRSADVLQEYIEEVGDDIKSSISAPTDPLRRLRVEKEIGCGPEIVYVYYNRNDRRLAELEKRDYWECKIGMTSGELDTRILGQGVLTAFARLPIVGLSIRTDNSKRLESILHEVLDRYGHKVSDGGGAEWFYTSPDRVEAWYQTHCAGVSALGKRL